eukprot:scaffold386175_cov19-Prasinocladus_malaysianus.AAC.1
MATSTTTTRGHYYYHLSVPDRAYEYSYGMGIPYFKDVCSWHHPPARDEKQYSYGFYDSYTENDLLFTTSTRTARTRSRTESHVSTLPGARTSTP